MKRLFVAMTIVALVAGAFGVEASAKKKKVRRVERTETVSYSAPGHVSSEVRFTQVCADGTGCFTFDVAPNERYLSVVATDTTGTPVPVQVEFGSGRAAESFCAATTEPIDLRGDVAVSVLLGVDAPPSCQGIATQGNVSVTFSNLP